MTSEDIVTLARSIRTESMRDRQALAWCYAQRYVLLRMRGWSGSFSDMVTAHSQPINPKWFPDGIYCRPGGQYHGEQPCRNAGARPGFASYPWSRIEPELKEFLSDWSSGRAGNNVPRCVDFRARDAETERIRSGQSSRDLQYVATDTANAFFTTSTSSRWPAGYVVLKPGVGFLLAYAATVVAVLGVFIGTLTLTSGRRR